MDTRRDRCNVSNRKSLTIVPSESSKLVRGTSPARTKRQPNSKSEQDLDHEIKIAELEKTRAETAAIYKAEVLADEKNHLEMDLLQAQRDKTIVEKDNLRRWVLAFAVTALTAITAAAGVTVQVVHEHSETEKLALQVERDQANVAREELELFKKQNPETAKLYEQLGALKALYQADEEKLRQLSRSKSPAKSGSK